MISMGLFDSSAKAQRILTVPVRANCLLALTDQLVLHSRDVVGAKKIFLPIDCVTFEFPSKNRPGLFFISSCCSFAKATETTFSAAPVSGKAEVREPFTKPERPLLTLVIDIRPLARAKSAETTFCAAPVSAKADVQGLWMKAGEPRVIIANSSLA